MRGNRPDEVKSFASLLTACWPLHPVVACLLGPSLAAVRAKYKEVFLGFLNSAESFGFQDFINTAEGNTFYTPDMLWDYLRANLEPSI